MEDVTQRLAILGPGTLGRDLALYAASCGWEVDMAGRSLDHAVVAVAYLRQRVLRMQRPALMDALDRIRPVEDAMATFATADVVFEALPEDLALKQRAWQSLEKASHPEARLLTGTSCLSPLAVGALMQVPERLAAFHLFVPMHHSRIVELAASPEQQAPLEALARGWGLEVIPVTGHGGLAASRMGLSMGLEAMRLLQEGAATPAALDRLMVQGYGLPVGPLELSDRVGLDVRLAIAQQLLQCTGDRRWEPPAILSAAVTVGHLGRKAGQGFYRWSPEGNLYDAP